MTRPMVSVIGRVPLGPASHQPGPQNSRERQYGQYGRILRFLPVSGPGMSSGNAANAGHFGHSPGEAEIQETGWWAHQGSNLGPAD
jgi:hypothetical protein